MSLKPEQFIPLTHVAYHVLLALFEEGIAHIRRAEGLLSAAETRVEELLSGGDGADTRPLIVDVEEG